MKPITPAARPGISAALLCIALILCVGATGCGYTTGSLLRKDIQSVSVEMFDNLTRRRGLEVDLTRQLTEEIRLRTPLKIKNPGVADSTLEGTLLEFVEEDTIRTEDNLILERTITVKVQFRWIDSLTGRDLVEPVEFEERNTFAVERGEPLAERIFSETAETIVEKMERQW